MSYVMVSDADLAAFLETVKSYIGITTSVVIPLFAILVGISTIVLVVHIFTK